MSGQLLLIGTSYFIGSFFFNTGWNESHIKYNNAVSTNYSLFSTSSTSRSDNKVIDNKSLKRKYTNYNQSEITFKLNLQHPLKHQLSYKNGTTKQLFVNIINEYSEIKTKEIENIHNVVMFDSSYQNIQPVFGIKPILHLNIGFLHLDKKSTHYDPIIENKIDDIVNETTQAALLETKLTLLWKGYTIKPLSHPILYSEIGVLLKQKTYYPTINFGGFYQLTDQFNISGQLGLKPLYSKSNSLVTNASIGVEYQF